MPIYEFYCSDCNTLFNFFSKTINTTKQPACPKCRKRKLERQVSAFAMTGKAKEGGGDDLPFDEAKMEKAVTALASQAENIKEDDPRQAAQLMRKFSSMTGMELGKGMTEALNRMESGEDPDKVEKEMGDLLEKEDPFVMPEKKGAKGHVSAPTRDETLYEL